MSRTAIRSDRPSRWHEHKLKTKKVDFTKLKRVRIDDRTEILIKPGLDPETEKQRFIKNMTAAKCTGFHKLIN